MRLITLCLLSCLSLQAHAWEPALPPDGFAADAAQGVSLYRQACARCHGSDPQRGGRWGPPLVHRIYRPDHHADVMFHVAIQRGVRPHHWRYGAMPAIPGISPEETAHIIVYIRQQQRMAGIE